jgi:quinol monooxygenase YgiN
MGIIGLEIQVRIKPENRQEFFQSYDMLLKPENKEPGCLFKGLFENTRGRNHFVWMERWDDPEALTIYRESEPFRMLMGAIDVLGNLVELRHVTLV